MGLSKARHLSRNDYTHLIDDQRTIIDHKTTKRSFPADAAAKDLHPTAYALAYRTLYGQNENGLRLDALVRTKQAKVQQLETTRTQADIDRFLQLAEHVERVINAQFFYPNDHLWDLRLQEDVWGMVDQVALAHRNVLISASTVSFSHTQSVECGDCDDAISSSSCSATRC